MLRTKTLSALAFLYFAQALSAQTQIITTVVGTGWTFPSTSLQATGAPLGKVSGVAIDAKGNIYVTDLGNFMVMKISPSGVLTMVAGNGAEGYSGNGGPATNAALSSPTDVAVDANGNLFIVDGSRIREVNTSGVITTVAGNGVLGYSADGPATSVAIDPYAGIAVDAGGNIYFNDTFNNIVREITGGNLITIAGTGKAGFAGDNGPASKAQLNNPSGLTLDASGNIYISDSLNHRVRMVSGSKGTIATIVGSGSAGSTGDGGAALTATLVYPAGLALDAKGDLYISDDVANDVRMVNSGQIVTTIAGIGTQGFSGDNGPAAKATLSAPFGLAMDSTGNAYIADSGNYRLRKVANAAGAGAMITTAAGNATFRFGGDGGLAIDAQLYSPAGLAFDSNGAMYIADTDNNRIRSVSANGTISTIAGNGLAGYVDGAAASASFSGPTGIAVDSGLNLYIADTGNNVVRKLTPGGTVSTVAGGGSNPFNENVRATTVALGTPTGVAVDSTGNLYIAASTSQKVFKVDTDGTIHSFAGYGTAGYDSTTTAANAALNTPLDVALDTAGNVYIADSQNYRVRKVTSSGIISTIAGNGSSSDVDGAVATSSGLFLPYGVAVDAAGKNLYIDEYGGRIRQVNLSTGIIQTVAGAGSPNVLGDGGTAYNAGINDPEAIALNPSGGLFIADTGNARVRAVISTAAASQPPPPNQPPPVQITFQATPLTLTFAGNNANGPSAPQAVSLTASIPGLNYTATGNAAWLSVTPASGTMPGSIQITANPSGMAAGTYPGLVTITAAAAATPTLTIAVTFTVTAATPPSLGVDTQSISLTATQGSSAVSQQIHVLDSGGGTVPFTVTTTAGGGTWLGVSAASGTATPASPAALNVTANPGSLAVGTYSGSVTVTGAGSSIAVPVTLTISPSTAVILVSQSAMTFTAVAQGGSPLAQSFGILNVGQGSMSWTASANTLSGGNWLQISPTSGSVQTPYLDVSLVDVSINPASLSAGTYYGQIQVASLATNTPQLLTVILTVLPAGFSLGPQVFPTGLIFTGVAGVTPSSQNVTIGNPAGSSTTTYQSGIIGAGFSFAPTNAALQAAQPSTLHVYPDFSSLSPASIQQGTITLQFSDRSPSQTVNVLIVVAPTGVTPTGAQAAGDLEERSHADAAGPKASSGCASQALQIQYRSLQTNFTATVGQGTALEVQVTDGCGNLVGPGGQNAQVTAYFTSGDTVTMTHIGNGIWQGTWRPVNTGTFVAKVTAVLQEGGNLVGGTSAPLTCVVSTPAPTAPTPIMTAQSVVQAASDLGGVPIAPGELITVYGTNLADGTSQATSLPLPQQAAGTTVMLGNIPLPILYTNTGQLNVQVPYTVPVNTQYQLSVQHGDTLSVPQTLVVAEAVPGIFTTNNQGSGQGDIFNGQGVIAQPGTPVHIGDEVVIYCTGLGALADGSISAGTASAGSATTNTTTATIGGQPATVVYSGLTAGFPGLYQVNVYVPSGIATGNAVPVTITVAGQTSATVTMAVQ
jgi:trimeric autotransporter adhesin